MRTTPWSSSRPRWREGHWRLARRIGKKRAAVAVAHSIIVSVWHILAHDVDYHDLGADYFNQRYDAAHETRRLVQRLEALGNTVTITPANWAHQTPDRSGLRPERGHARPHANT